MAQIDCKAKKVYLRQQTSPRFFCTRRHRPPASGSATQVVITALM